MPEPNSAAPDSRSPPLGERAWKLLLALRSAVRDLDASLPARFGITSDGGLSRDSGTGPLGCLEWSGGSWQAQLAVPEPLLELYLPLCEPLNGRPRLLGHLGQSIDGYIATAGGDSNYVNDPANIRHLHRLRALHDAVVVGAGTIAADDPQLTTRRVEGPSPVRVVLDPRRRLPAAARVFSDGAAETVLVVAESIGGPERQGLAEVIFVPAGESFRFDLSVLIARLVERGLARIFVEGGGATVSAFQDGGWLDRLQIAVAPVLTGRGAPGLRLAPRARMQDCARPIHRTFVMGRDILFDCDLHGGEAIAPDAGGDGEIRRIR